MPEYRDGSAALRPKPAADVDTGPGVVRELLAEQHPDLSGRELEFAGDGWDNAVYRLGEELAVRLPRRANAHSLLLNELRWLPFLAPRLPLPVPGALWQGRPSAGYPYHWAIVPWFEGVSAASVPALGRDAYAVDLARFLRALHVPAPADAPFNPVRGVPLATRDEAVRGRLGSGLLPDAAALEAIWDDSLAATKHAGPALWLHGDLHPHNLLVDSSFTGARITAVIDFGDLTAGDPASDLAAAWLHFHPAREGPVPPGAGRRFLLHAGGLGSGPGLGTALRGADGDAAAGGPAA
ncbi:aminoglycoside phosphotransferase family protein [Paeniglutamicibacter cryotolerans]|uniref:Aminoglycoside phosphotransferase (APT) family kinase protein n=1 Tax=Paeniglutamicibacter cryotolerans TaxID=670079 RepID=A0A839QIP1_9MICC|nr:aminoglycoside phosphotransferase family protein [Paeniglutamicibacter cryotolerans]MBB2996059.1 aminoglycoside phosphotransferase (APT) family kinase protein [Paeniglutamicibacter cryotolerans]